MKFLFTIILLIAFPDSNSKTDLSLNLKQGDIYKQKYSASSKINQTIMGMDQEIEMFISSEVNYFVKSKSEDTYILDVSYKGMGMEMKTAMGEMEFNSENEGDDLISNMMKSMIDKKFTITLTNKGRIRKIENLDNMFSDVLKSFPDLPEAQKQQVKAQLEQAYGEKAFKGNLEMMLAIFPDKNVKEGDSWTNDIKLESGMSAFLKNTFTLEEITKDYVLIKADSDVSTEAKDAYIQVNGMPTRYDLEGKFVASYKLDPETNWVSEGNIVQKMSGEVNIGDNPQLPGGIVFPMSVTTEMKVNN